MHRWAVGKKRLKYSDINMYFNTKSCKMGILLKLFYI